MVLDLRRNSSCEVARVRTGEFAFIDWLRRRTPSAHRVVLGPGDDTAILSWPKDANCLITTDMLLEGSCFRLAETHPGEVGAGTARQIGRKAMAVNLSDIAAMAGVPVAAVVSVGLPRRGGRSLAEELYLGLREMADAFDTAIVGGDTNSWEGPLVISVTLLGEATPRGAVCRKGARPGDVLMVTGPLGGSILGKHLDFTPRVREALALHAAVDLHAMIDISDGLAADLAHLIEESGCGIVLRADAIPIADAARALADQRTPLEHALGDGEDFELVFAVSPADASTLLSSPPIPGLAVIGECLAEPGLFLETNGQRSLLPPLGYIHTLE
jgi:thiamine-monophosphate kinase